MRTPGEGGAEWPKLVTRKVNRAEEATNGAERKDMQHLDTL